MKIGPQDPSIVQDPAGSATGRARQRPEGDTRAALMRASGVASALGKADGTEVRLSALATAAMAPASVSADVDLDKVKRVQAELAQGRYRVNPEAIADELIANAQAFMKPGNR